MTFWPLMVFAACDSSKPGEKKIEVEADGSKSLSELLGLSSQQINQLGIKDTTFPRDTEIKAILGTDGLPKKIIVTPSQDFQLGPYTVLRETPIVYQRLNPNDSRLTQVDVTLAEEYRVSGYILPSEVRIIVSPHNGKKYVYLKLRTRAKRTRDAQWEEFYDQKKLVPLDKIGQRDSNETSKFAEQYDWFSAYQEDQPKFNR